MMRQGIHPVAALREGRNSKEGRMNHHAGMLILESQQHLARLSSLLSCHRLMAGSLPRAPLVTRHMTSTTAISFGCTSLRGQVTTRNEALPGSCKLLFSTSTSTTCVWLNPRSLTRRRRTIGLLHSPLLLLSRGFSCMAKMPADGVNGSSRDSGGGDGHVGDLSKQQEASEMSDFVCSNMGAIHLIVGPMFAGKTTALLQRVRKEADAGRLLKKQIFGGNNLYGFIWTDQKESAKHLFVRRRVGLVKSDKDTRYGVAAVVSHDGVQMPCVAAPSLATFREHIGEEEYNQMEVIGIDEAQFFDDLLDFCQGAADLDNKTVIVAGLDGDFLRRKFGSALDLIPLADSVTKLHARCELCGQPALFTFRKTGDTKTEVIGGADVYMPVCRHHFVSGQVAVESARTVLQDHQEAKQAHAINL